MQRSSTAYAAEACSILIQAGWRDVMASHWRQMWGSSAVASGKAKIEKSSRDLGQTCAVGPGRPSGLATSRQTWYRYGT